MRQPRRPALVSRNIPMKRRFPFVVVLVIFTATSAFAQSAAYSFDNFDTRNGIKVHTEPVRAQPLAVKPALGSKRSGAKASTDNQPSASVQTTALKFEPVMSAGNVASSLRGFTTGNAEVDGYIMESASRNGVDPLLIYSIMHQESSF